jgi:hypothetical protein
MDSETLTLRLHNAQLAAAIRAIVDRDLSYLDGFVCGGAIPWNSIRQAREVLRVTAAAALPAKKEE